MRWRRHPVWLALLLAWRFAWGMHLDGRKRSDARFFRRGTYAEPHYLNLGGHSRWAIIPGWQRAAIRWAFIVIPVGLMWRPMVVVWMLALTLGPAAGLCCLLALAKWRAYEHHRDTVGPLHSAIASELGIPLADKPGTYMTVPQDYTSNPDAVITIEPPHDFAPSDTDKANLVRIIQAKTGIEQPEAQWKLQGSKPLIILSKSDPPPARVGLADIRAAMTDTAEHEVIIGLGRKLQVGAVSVDNDSPHVGVSMGSGDGKSTFARNFASQMLHKGCLLLVIDYKLISHMWARGLPNVAYAGTPAEIEAALTWLAEEVQRRNRVALAGADIEGNVHADVGPRILVIAEELNATQQVLRHWWRREMGEKGRSPGSEALDEVMFMGRQVHVNVMQIGQRLSVRATGSGDARENLGVLIFSDPTAAAWKMLCPQHVMPAATGHLGRLQVVTRKSVREIQGAFMTGEQARHLATSGTVAVPRPEMPLVTRPRVLVLPNGGEQRDTPPDLPVVVGPVPPPQRPPGSVTLREAWQAGLFTSVDAARKAVQRYQPEVVGREGASHLFLISDLAKCRNGRTT